MADIVDDEENIKRFMTSMNNFTTTFTQGKNYGSPSKGALKSSTSSAAPSPAFVPTVMDPIDKSRPGTPYALSPLESRQVPKRHPQETLSSWEIVPQETCSPVTPPRSLPSGGQLPHSGEWSNENSPPDSTQTKNIQSLKVESVVNKPLLSPQLIGRIAPPPTPESVAHDDPSNGHNGHNIEDLIRYHVGQRLESKAEPVGLGESIYASHRSSHLTRTLSSARPKFGTIDDEAGPSIVTPTCQMSHERRRERDLSYERLSFSIANSTPVLAPAVKAMPSSENIVDKQPGKASRAGSEPDTAAGVPPHPRVREQSPVPGHGTMSEPKMQDHTQTLAGGQHSPTPVVKGIQAGLAVLRAKYGGRSSSAPQKAEEPTVQQTLDKSEEQVSEVRTASSTASNDNHKPAHLKLDPQTHGIVAKPTSPLTSDFTPSGTSENLTRPGAVEVMKSSTSSIIDQAQAVATTTSNLVTPSSANFAMISPSTGRHVEANAASSAANIVEEGSPIFFGRFPKPEARDAPGSGRTAPKSADGSTIYFGSFPIPEGRRRPAARVRKAVLSNLPLKCTAKTVASLVYGGPLESIIMKPNACAEVLFIDPDECFKFCNDNSNGLVYGKGKNDYIFVDPHTEVDIVGGKLSQMIELGVTRCVLVIGKGLDFTKEDLWELAQAKNRNVESIDDSITPKGHRIITFRFCKMEDANNFKGVLQRDPEWEHCNIRFAPDPCTTATGPRFEAQP